MLTPVHQQLEERQLLPGEHLAGSGYPPAELIIYAARVFGITLVSPLRLDNSAQARAGAGYDKAAFAFDRGARQATCPQGTASSTWTPCRQRHEEAIVLSWPATACLPCPARQLCTSSRRRQITIRPRELHEALASARTQQTSAQWKARYNARAGAEGTMRQATHVTGIRRARYLGLPKTQLEHNIAAAAINMIRMDAYWTGHPLDRTRSSHLARLDCRFSGLMAPEAALSCGPAGFLTGLSAGFFSPVCRFPRWPAARPWRAAARQLAAGSPSSGWVRR